MDIGGGSGRRWLILGLDSGLLWRSSPSIEGREGLRIDMIAIDVYVELDENVSGNDKNRLLHQCGQYNHLVDLIGNDVCIIDVNDSRLLLEQLVKSKERHCGQATKRFFFFWWSRSEFFPLRRLF